MANDAVLICTNAPNDATLVKALGSMAMTLPIASGDVCFSGAGDNGTHLLVCCERKKIGDLCSCIQTGRYLHQLQIAKSNGADTFVLIVEGAARPGLDDGLLEVPVWCPSPRSGKRARTWVPVKPTTTYSRFDQYLTELAYLAGIIVKRSQDVRETASIIKALWDNFQTAPGKHHSLHQIYTTPPAKVDLVYPGLTRRVAKELSGIGWSRSRDAASYFGSVFKMVNATEEEWQEIPGIGKKIARQTVQDIRSGEKIDVDNCGKSAII